MPNFDLTPDAKVTFTRGSEIVEIRAELFFKLVKSAKKSAQDLGVSEEALIDLIHQGGLVDLIKFAEMTQNIKESKEVPDTPDDLAHPVDFFLKPEFRLRKSDFKGNNTRGYGRFYWWQGNLVRLVHWEGDKSCLILHVGEGGWNIKERRGFGSTYGRKDLEYTGDKNFNAYWVSDLSNEITDIQTILKHYPSHQKLWSESSWTPEEEGSSGSFGRDFTWDEISL